MAYDGPNPIPVVAGGTGAATFTSNGILYGNTTSALQVTAQGGSHTVLTANAGAPSFSATPTITSVTFGSGTALNTYVEGTWTPTLNFGGATTGITYTTQIGEYTQIGRMVTCAFEIVLSSKGSASGISSFTGLPVTSGASGGNIGGSSVVFSGLTLTALYNQVNFIVFDSGTTGEFYQCGSGQTYSTITDTAFANTTRLQGTFSYFTS